jgi:hypothetical protein
VALAGKLEEVPAAEILQFLAMSEKSGKLSFTTGTEEGLIVFRDGKIIYAASSSLRETLGSIVIAMKLVTEPELAEALSRQHKTGEDKRLGMILVEMGVLTGGDLQKVLHHQVLNVLREMFSWERGFFMFRNLSLEDHGEVEVDARDLVVEQPLDARRVALDAARQHDEDLRDKPEAGEERARHFVLDAASDAEAEDGEPSGLREVIGDFTGPSITAETVREVFDHAAKVFDRGIILAVHSHGIRGLAQYGLSEEGEPPSQRVRRLWLPVDEPSVVSWAITLGSSFRGKAEQNRWNEVLFKVLGGSWPQESVAIPIRAFDRVTMVFYGDNEPNDLPVGSTTLFEERLQEVGDSLANGSAEAGGSSEGLGSSDA